MSIGPRLAVSSFALALLIPFGGAWATSKSSAKLGAKTAAESETGAIAVTEGSEAEMMAKLQDVRGDADSLLDAKLVADAGDKTAPAKVEAKIDALTGKTDVAAPTVVPQAGAPAPAAPTTTETAPVTIESKAEVAKLPENQIPVLSSAAAAKKAEGNPFARVMITLGVVAALLFATLFGLKRWAKRKGIKSDNTKIRVLTQHALGPKKSLCIVQVAGESILLGVTDHNISMIKTLSLIDDEVPDEVPNRFDSAMSDFEDMEMARQSRVIRGTAKGKAKNAEAAETEDFAMRGLNEIRDTVSTRLRNMKNI